MIRAGRVPGLEAIRMLLALGFRVRGAIGSEVTLERGASMVCVPRDGDLSDRAFTMLLDAAHIDPDAADRLLARLRCRDTLPDTWEARSSAGLP
jgi:hypothetical protein